MRVTHEADMMGIRDGWDLGHQRSRKELPTVPYKYPLWGLSPSIYSHRSPPSPLDDLNTGESKVSSQLYSPATLIQLITLLHKVTCPPRNPSPLSCLPGCFCSSEFWNDAGPIVKPALFSTHTHPLHGPISNK